LLKKIATKNFEFFLFENFDDGLTILNSKERKTVVIFNTRRFPLPDMTFHGKKTKKKFEQKILNKKNWNKKLEQKIVV
jgi:hypothetical protein